MWSVADIADGIADGLARYARQLDDEHAVYGMDALDEVSLHPILADALVTAGYGVHREQRYPADRRKRKESEGERCDLVLTPDGRVLRVSEAKATLFEPADAVETDDAFWLEIKTVSQFTTEGASASYTGQLMAPIRRDVTKLSKDTGILHAGLLIVLFVRDELVAEHDLEIWQDRCLQRTLPIAAPCRRSIPIADRHGNGLCYVALYPVRHL